MIVHLVSLFSPFSDRGERSDRTPPPAAKGTGQLSTINPKQNKERRWARHFPLTAIQVPLFTISPFCRNILEVVYYPGISRTDAVVFLLALPAGLTNFGTASCRK
jgi:hypothetical protein